MATEDPIAPVAAPAEPATATATAKVKKAKKPAAPKKSSSHPTYLEVFILEASISYIVTCIAGSDRF